MYYMDTDKIEYEKYLDLNKYIRVLKLSTTPTREEFMQVSKIVLTSILLVGLLGYIIFYGMDLIPM